MEPIKIEVAINVNVDMSQGTKDFLLKVLERKIEAENERAEKAASSLLSLLALAQSGCNKPTDTSVKEAEISNAVEAMVQKASEAGKAAGAARATEAKKAEPSKEEPKSEKTVSIEDVRAVLATKVNDHRETIKAKLNELGSPSVTKLEPSKYQEMYDFLNSL